MSADTKAKRDNFLKTLVPNDKLVKKFYPRLRVSPAELAVIFFISEKRIHYQRNGH